MPTLARAEALATEAHAGQTRKGTGEPYIGHPARVAELASRYTDDEESLAAAWLHDVAEDTAVSLGDIEAALGPGVAALVGALTNPPEVEGEARAARIARNRAHSAAAPPRAKVIKACDVMANLGGIEGMPRDWAVLYVQEKRRLQAVLADDLAPRLAEDLESALSAAEAALA